MRGVVFGDIGVNSDVASPDPCGGSVPKAGALVLTFLLNNFRDPEYQRLAEKWEKEVRDFLCDFSFDPSSPLCSMTRERKRGVVVAVVVVVLVHVVVVVLSSIVRADCRCYVGTEATGCCERDRPVRWLAMTHKAVLL